ncbi:MAG: ABC transporter ATP-binding protein [Planctomycetota bacterium]|jgi:ABC-2 type transport system ATP-binding protein
MSIVNIQQVEKRYKDVQALRSIDLQIEEGDSFGFIGPNGAGKTTTLKILATLLRPTAGKAEVCGIDVARRPDDVKPLIGYMPDVLGVYDDMLVQEYLEFFAAAYRIHGEKRRKVIDDVLALTDLGGKRDAQVRSLSRGMGQRLGLARVLLHDPKVLLLDEPAAGLDPRARIEFKELVQELRGMGKTLLISSHILSEIGMMCNTIGIIEQGKMLFAGTIDEVREKVRPGIRVRVEVRDEAEEGRTNEEAMELLRGHPDIEALRPAERGFEVLLRSSTRDASIVSHELVSRNFRILHFAEIEVDLEEVFLHVTNGQVA